MTDSAALVIPSDLHLRGWGTHRGGDSEHLELLLQMTELASPERKKKKNKNFFVNSSSQVLF